LMQLPISGDDKGEFVILLVVVMMIVFVLIATAVTTADSTHYDQKDHNQNPEEEEEIARIEVGVGVSTFAVVRIPMHGRGIAVKVHC